MDADTPDLGQDKRTIVQPCAISILFEGEGVETVTPLEAGKPGFLPTLDATEERLLRLVQPR